MKNTLEFKIIDHSYNKTSYSLKEPSVDYNGFIDIPNKGDHVWLETTKGSLISFKVLEKIIKITKSDQDHRSFTRFILTKSRRSDLPGFHHVSNVFNDYFEEVFNNSPH